MHRSLTRSQEKHIPYDKNFAPLHSRPATNHWDVSLRAADIDKLYIRVQSNYPVSVLASVV
jgi:hypothetical protein